MKRRALQTSDGYCLEDRGEVFHEVKKLVVSYFRAIDHLSYLIFPACRVWFATH